MFTANLPVAVSILLWLCGIVRGWILVAACAYIVWRDGDCRTQPNGPVRGGR